MVRLILLDDRDELKQKCRNRLLGNEKTITTSSLDISGQHLPGTVRNVLRFYNVTVGITERVNTLQQTEFFSKLNTIVLDPDEQMAIRRLIDVYEHLKLSSLTPEGLEESVSFVDGGEKRILREGRLEHLRTDDAAKLIGSYMGNRASEEKIEPRVTIGGRDSAYEEYRQEIMKEIDRISKEAGNDPVKVKGIFARALEVENISEVTAAMYYLAHRKQLQDILRQNASWLRATKEFVSRHYSDQRADIYIEKHPASPEALSAFFQYLLTERLKLSIPESALVGMDVGRFLGGVYEGIAFWDQTIEEFDWAPLQFKDESAARTKGAMRPLVVKDKKSLSELLEFAKGRMQSWFLTEKALGAKMGSDPVELKKQLVNALKIKDVGKTVAILLILAREGRLQAALKEGPNWRETVKSYASEKYNAEVVKQFIDDNSTHPIVMSEFLQYLLQQRLGLTENESAMIGMELGDRMGEEYRTMAYADEKEGEFRWVKNRVEKGKLVQEL